MGKDQLIDTMGLPEYMLSAVTSIPIYLDKVLNNVYIIPMGWFVPGTHRPALFGSVQAFGAIYAWNLANAYRPEGLQW